MDIDEFRRRVPPQVRSNETLPGEVEFAHFAGINLQSLEIQRRNFDGAVALFNYASNEETRFKALMFQKPRPADFSALKEKADMYNGWQWIAARDAVCSIYRFNEEIKALITASNKCDSIKRYVNAADRKEGIKAFNSTFRGFKKLRNGVAHAGEFYSSVQGFSAHSSPTEGLTIHQLDGSTFSTSIDGRTLSLSLTSESVQRLEHVKMLIWDAYRPIEDADRNRRAETRNHPHH